MEGTLQEGTLYRALVELAGASSTGILTVQGEEEIIAFSLLQGEIVSADALNQTLEEALGELLTKRQLVAAEDFGGLAAEYQAGGGRVVDLLVERAYLTREQLLELLREHTYRLCLEAFTWRRGEYRFYQGEEVAFEEGFRAIDVDELSVRATLDLGPSGPLGGGVPKSSSILQKPPGKAPSGEELLGARRGAMAPAVVQRLFELIDGKRSLEEVAAAAGVSRFTVQHLVSLWSAEGLVTTSPGGAETGPGAEALGTLPELAEEVSGPIVEPSPSLDLLELDQEPRAVPAQVTGRQIRKRETPRLTPWPSRVMGLGLWAAAAFLLITQPSRLLLPFPWQGGLREAYQKQQRAVLHLKIEQAATTFFLLNGRFPEELEELRAARLLSRRDLKDPSGRPLVMSSATASYLVESLGEDDAEETTLTATIAGNILLDPELRLPERASEPPLVLLD